MYKLSMPISLIEFTEDRIGQLKEELKRSSADRQAFGARCGSGSRGQGHGGLYGC